MHFAVLPPEVNSGRMYAGPGAGPMLAAATAWAELANELHTTAANLESVISGLTSEPWQGPAAASMAAAAAPQVEWLNTTAAQATQSSTQAKAAVAAYESAYAMTVPPPVVAANRAELTYSSRPISWARTPRRSRPLKSPTAKCGPRTSPRCTAMPASCKQPRQ